MFWFFNGDEYLYLVQEERLHKVKKSACNDIEGNCLDSIWFQIIGARLPSLTLL